MKHPIRNLIAIHEAGHAIVAAHLGLPIEYVTIAPDGCGRDGHLKPGANDPTATGVEPHLVATAAGEMAVYLYDPRGNDRLERSRRRMPSGVHLRRQVPHVHTDGELVDAMHRLSQADPLAVTDDDVRAARHKANARAADILAGRWRAVMILADELYVHRRVEGARVAEIIDGCPDDTATALKLLTRAAAYTCLA